MSDVVYIQVDPEQLYAHIHETVRLFFPGMKLVRGDAGLPCLQVWRCQQHGQTMFKGQLTTDDKTSEYSTVYPTIDHDEIRRLARVFTLEMLTSLLDQPVPPYGILTGIRPTKLVHNMFDRGWEAKRVSKILGEEYLLSPDKAELLCQIAERERPALHDPKKAAQLISIYIGIPYCPTRCFYCSFPGSQLKQPETELDAFLSALKLEIAGVASGIEHMGLQIENLYIGGGTPSILGAQRMQELIHVLKQSLPLVTDLEFTVEAGRPDTVDDELVAVLKQAGVNRVCINPQTMNDITLQRIGRCHSVEQVLQAVSRVRAAGIPVLNMDVIVGLPGEGVQEWQQTLSQLADLHPENITVHTLAAKKGSTWALEEGVGQREQGVGAGVRLFSSELLHNGYEPYYLYRQKNMRADAENIGYSLPGTICRYNIQVIEERQTIIGLGGGAGSKYVRTKDWSLTATYNPKNPEVYLTSIDRLVATKVDKLRNLNIE